MERKWHCLLKIENVQVFGFEPAIRGMRNPMNSWAKSDSFFSYDYDSLEFISNRYISEEIGENDHYLMAKLARSGSAHAKYRRMIVVYLDIIAPLYWWKEFDTYKIGTVVNSCSTMHKIQEKEFTLDDFSHEHLLSEPIVGVSAALPPISVLKTTIDTLNAHRKAYLELLNIDNEAFEKAPKAHGITDNSLPEARKILWWQMIQLLPSSYNQRRTVMLNYEVLAGLYPERKNHKLDEWHVFCDWVWTLPYSELITGEEYKRFLEPSRGGDLD